MTRLARTAARPALLIALLAALLAAGAARAEITPQPAAGPFQAFLPMVQRPAGAPAPPAQGSLPATLARQWFAGSLTSISFYDAATGAWSQPSGLGELYRFGADGSFTYGGSIKFQNGACVTEASVYQTGTARDEGGVLVLDTTFSRTRTRIACGTVSDTTTTDLPAQKRIPWSVAVGDRGRTELTLGEGQQAKAFALMGIDSQILGAWRRGGASSAGFYDPATGQWAQPDSDGEWYRFGADGRFTYGLYRQQEDQGCLLTLWVYQEGQFEMSGSRLTIRNTSGHGRLENACTGEVTDEPFVDAKLGEYAWAILDGGAGQLELQRLMPFDSRSFDRE